MHVRSLAIWGEGRGKGIYLNELTECCCADLWIDTTYDGAALYVNSTVMVSEFHNIHCYGNGSVDSQEATLVIASQTEGDANNNLHFDKVYILLPNYRGVEIGAETGGRHPRLIFFTQSFFHGWGPVAAPYDLFHIHACDTTRGVVVSDSRFTQAGETSSLVHVETGGIRISSCVLGGGTGGTAITAESGTQVQVTDSRLQVRSSPECSLRAEGADVTFVNNQLDGSGQTLQLHSVASALVTGNHFSTDPRQPAVRVVGSDPGASERVLISGNIFPHADVEAAVQYRGEQGGRAVVRDNLYAGRS